MTTIRKQRPASIPVHEELDGRPSTDSLASLAARGGAESDRLIDRLLPGPGAAPAVRSVTFNSSL
ncbi:hypothetical protein EDE04_5358 [Streptomyces sp. 2132.2]|uniref:hypothetical protein n=1 Tax=Streptomyces sp. 2132.2 TaxID=2485161 RepID=UPI000C197D06|nr:hypothetical protein [Streptomyces sp. 2132.2]ROQ98817.1 hypothetical protein EDE04_5358 [Streptomyces sp. 2132.2]